MKIAVYSGSFNPLHKGHEAIIRFLTRNPLHKGHEAIIRFLTREAGFDKVYLVVTPQNPFKDRHSLPAGQDRFDAALAAVRRHPDLNVQVEDVELHMTPPQYTIRTLEVLQNREPQNEFTLIIGADNLAVFDGWRYYERILTEFGVAVFPRKGYHRGHARARLMKKCPGARIVLLKAMAAGKDMSKWFM